MEFYGNSQEIQIGGNYRGFRTPRGNDYDTSAEIMLVKRCFYGLSTKKCTIYTRPSSDQCSRMGVNLSHWLFRIDGSMLLTFERKIFRTGALPTSKEVELIAHLRGKFVSLIIQFNYCAEKKQFTTDADSTH